MIAINIGLAVIDGVVNDADVVVVIGASVDMIAINIGLAVIDGVVNGAYFVVANGASVTTITGGGSGIMGVAVVIVIGEVVVVLGGTIGAADVIIGVTTGAGVNVTVVGVGTGTLIGIGAIVSGLLFSLHRLSFGFCGCVGNVRGIIFPFFIP